MWAVKESLVDLNLAFGWHVGENFDGPGQRSSKNINVVGIAIRNAK
jgi:hypothetical protein